MKALTRALALLGLLTVSALGALAFEGRVSLGFSDSKGREQVIDYAMKGALVRLEPKMKEAGGAAMIMDADKREMTILMPEQRMYMTMPLRGTPGEGKGTPDAKDVKVEKTGRTEKVLGYDCEEYVMSDRGQTTEMWITEQLGSFMGLSGANPMGGMMGGRKAKTEGRAWEQVLKDKKGAFPLRVVGHDAKGKETFRLEAKKIEPGNVPDDLFTAPAGFQKFAMPNMGGFGG
ncbi:MAG: DUF4412 domain-containing protein [Candidatus Didemnitutus sp.]|nr:DUF4412 domain-containing protein [Candidatus Didemnitutus sp.]